MSSAHDNFRKTRIALADIVSCRIACLARRICCLTPPFTNIWTSWSQLRRIVDRISWTSAASCHSDRGQDFQSSDWNLVFSLGSHTPNRGVVEADACVTDEVSNCAQLKSINEETPDERHVVTVVSLAVASLTKNTADQNGLSACRSNSVSSISPSKKFANPT